MNAHRRNRRRETRFLAICVHCARGCYCERVSSSRTSLSSRRFFRTVHARALTSAGVFLIRRYPAKGDWFPWRVVRQKCAIVFHRVVWSANSCSYSVRDGELSARSYGASRRNPPTVKAISRDDKSRNVTTRLRKNEGESYSVYCIDVSRPRRLSSLRLLCRVPRHPVDDHVTWLCSCVRVCVCTASRTARYRKEISLSREEAREKELKDKGAERKGKKRK